MTIHRRLSPYIFGASLFIAGVRAEPPPPQSPPPPGEPGREHGAQKHIFIYHGDKPQEKEIVTFLGVETMPASATLTAQLGLPPGTGLVVSHVVPDTPAATVLQQHDIVLKLDDQLLIDPCQFSVLVRNHHEGDSVVLTYMRGGKQATATVKLVKHEVPKAAFFFHHLVEPGLPIPAEDAEGLPHLSREDTEDVLGLVSPRPETRHAPTPGNIGYRALRVDPANSNIIYSDDRGSLELTIKDGNKTLVAKGPKGESIFSGPITTPDERKALPPEVLQRLDRIEGMHEFSFETDENFDDQVKVAPAGKTKIVYPFSSKPASKPEPELM